jgi:hypothetical protein
MENCTHTVFDCFTQILPRCKPRKSGIGFARRRLQRGGKIPRKAVRKIKAQKHAQYLSRLFV